MNKLPKDIEKRFDEKFILVDSPCLKPITKEDIELVKELKSFIAVLLKERDSEHVNIIENKIPSSMVIKPFEVPLEMFEEVLKNNKLVIEEIKKQIINLMKQRND